MSERRYPVEPRAPAVLTVDVGGSHVKLSIRKDDARRFASHKGLTPTALVEQVRTHTDDWSYDVISLGFPGMAGPDGPEGEPGNLGEGWIGFDFERAFGKPVRLVNDAVLRLIQADEHRFADRAHIMALASQMMRHILVDYARQHSCAKRGGGAQQVTLDDGMLVSKDKGEELLAIDDALRKLEQFDKRKSQVAVMRFFAGLTTDETAEALNISVETVTRDWRMARAWLRNELSAAA